jgi:hypothetical protein
LLVEPVAAEMTLMRLADRHFVLARGVDRAGRQRYALHTLMSRFSTECLTADTAMPGTALTGAEAGGPQYVGLRQ